MLTLKPAPKNSPLVYSSDQHINNLYLNCRALDGKTQCFHFVDKDNQVQGFYGILIDNEIIDDTYHLMIDLIGLHLKSGITQDQYLDPFIDHLFELLECTIIDAQAAGLPKMMVDVIAENDDLKGMVETMIEDIQSS